MAKASNGLAEALRDLTRAQAALVQSQATFLQSQADMNARHERLEREAAATFARIDERFNRIEAILLRHEEILQNLPEAVRSKIGFQPPDRPK